jgi:hypothetical protein
VEAGGDSQYTVVQVAFDQLGLLDSDGRLEGVLLFALFDLVDELLRSIR